MEKLDLSKKNLKKYGITMAVACIIIAALLSFKHRHVVVTPCVIGLVFFLVAVTVPAVLKPVYIVWMRLAFVLGWCNTRLILILLFYLMLTPLGLLLKLFGADFLERKIKKEEASYWKKIKEKKYIKHRR